MCCWCVWKSVSHPSFGAVEQMRTGINKTKNPTIENRKKTVFRVSFVQRTFFSQHKLPIGLGLVRFAPSTNHCYANISSHCNFTRIISFRMEFHWLEKLLLFGIFFCWCGFTRTCVAKCPAKGISSLFINCFVMYENARARVYKSNGRKLGRCTSINNSKSIHYDIVN